MSEAATQPMPNPNRVGVLLNLAEFNLADYQESKDETCLASALSDVRSARQLVEVHETIAVQAPPVASVPLASATPRDLVDATLGLLRQIDAEHNAILDDSLVDSVVVHQSAAFDLALAGSIDNLTVASALLQSADPIGVGAFDVDPSEIPEPPRHPRLAAMLLSSIGYAKNIARSLYSVDVDEANDLDELARNLEAVHKLAATGPATVRVVLANADGLYYERGSCPDQVWATDNPMAALHWPDLPTALASLTSPQFERAYAKAKATKFVLKRIVVAVEDFTDGEIEDAVRDLAEIRDLADRLAVAG